MRKRLAGGGALVNDIGTSDQMSAIKWNAAVHAGLRFDNIPFGIFSVYILLFKQDGVVRSVSFALLQCHTHGVDGERTDDDALFLVQQSFTNQFGEVR